MFSVSFQLSWWSGLGQSARQLLPFVTLGMSFGSIERPMPQSFAPILTSHCVALRNRSSSTNGRWCRQCLAPLSGRSTWMHGPAASRPRVGARGSRCRDVARNRTARYASSWMAWSLVSSPARHMHPASFAAYSSRTLKRPSSCPVTRLTYEATSSRRRWRGRSPAPRLHLAETGRRRWLRAYLDQVLHAMLHRSTVAVIPRACDGISRRWPRAPCGPCRGEEALLDAAGINARTAAAYDGLLANLFIVESLPAWSTNRRSALLALPNDT